MLVREPQNLSPRHSCSSLFQILTSAPQSSASVRPSTACRQLSRLLFACLTSKHSHSAGTLALMRESLHLPNSKSKKEQNFKPYPYIPSLLLDRRDEERGSSVQLFTHQLFPPSLRAGENIQHLASEIQIPTTACKS